MGPVFDNEDYWQKPVIFFALRWLRRAGVKLIRDVETSRSHPTARTRSPARSPIWSVLGRSYQRTISNLAFNGNIFEAEDGLDFLQQKDCLGLKSPYRVMTSIKCWGCVEACNITCSLVRHE